MKFCMVNKLALVNIFVLHTLHGNINYSAIITQKKSEKTKNLKSRGRKKSQDPVL